jgi:hypothetical protein
MYQDDGLEEAIVRDMVRFVPSSRRSRLPSSKPMRTGLMRMAMTISPRSSVSASRTSCHDVERCSRGLGADTYRVVGALGL